MKYASSYISLWWYIVSIFSTVVQYNLTLFAPYLYYFHLCGSRSVFRIRIRIHKIPENESNLDPDLHHTVTRPKGWPTHLSPVELGAGGSRPPDRHRPPEDKAGGDHRQLQDPPVQPERWSSGPKVKEFNIFTWLLRNLSAKETIR